MISRFEVGAILKIVDQASPALGRILRQVRELNLAIEKARVNLAEIGKGTGAASTGIAKATGETEALAAAWKNVAKNAAGARAMTGWQGRSDYDDWFVKGRSDFDRWFVGPPGSGARMATGRRDFEPSPGLHTGLPFGGPLVRIGSAVATTAIGLAGYGIAEAAQMEDAVFQLIYHSASENTQANRAKFRKILQDAMVESGYGLHDIAESAKQEIRMFQGTKGGGIDVLPEMLRAATIESRLKGESPEESMKALIGLTHMTKQYDPESIKKLAPAFAFLSTANPSSLSSIERAAGYAVPILQSSLEIDPMQSLLLGTALTRAGATSTKSGTWLREMALRTMPGTAIFESEKKAEHHDELLRRLGLLDDKDKPTWFTNGKPDIFKMLETAGTNLEKIPLTERAGVERKLFGAQGSGGLALLADPAVREQVTALRKEMDSPEFKNRYAGFTEAYQKGSTVQQARTALQDFNVTMMDLGAHVLPSVTGALRDFKAALEGLRAMVPAAARQGAAAAKIGARVIEGAGAGIVFGLAGGPGGVMLGGLGGGILGGVEGFWRACRNHTSTTTRRSSCTSWKKTLGQHQEAPR